MFRGIEITSRKNSGEIISQRSSLQGCIFVGSVETVNIFFKLGVVVFCGQLKLKGCLEGMKKHHGQTFGE